jgi:hypothetical protein
VLHRLVDEPAALAPPNHPVNGLDRGFRQNNIDAFAHESELQALIHILYTIDVYYNF